MKGLRPSLAPWEVYLGWSTFALNMHLYSRREPCMRPLRSIWLFRHGLRADWEKDFCPPDVFTKDNDLAAAGIEQFEYCAQYLATQSVDHLIASPYRRCIHSAEIIARRLNIVIHLEWGIHESHGGELPPIAAITESHQRYPHVSLTSHSLLSPASFESEEDWRQRGKQAILALLKAYDGNLCIVSHGHPLLAMQQALLPGFRPLGMRCASFSRFDYFEGTGWQIGIPYSVEHLGTVDISRMRHIDWVP